MVHFYSCQWWFPKLEKSCPCWRIQTLSQAWYEVLSRWKRHYDVNAATLAGEIALICKFKFYSSDRSQFHTKRGRFVSSQQTPASDSKDKTHADKSSGKSQSTDQSSGPVCGYCKKHGHLVSDCFKLKRKNENEALSNELVKSCPEMPITDSRCTITTHSSQCWTFFKGYYRFFGTIK